MTLKDPTINSQTSTPAMNGKLEVPKSSEPQLMIQRLYVKDISFESPQVPKVFQSAQTMLPDVDLQLKVSTTQLEPGLHEVELRITVHANASHADADGASSSPEALSLFCVEVKQAGIFHVQGIEEQDPQLDALLNITCPGILYPYASALISHLVTCGTFMPLHLAPVNFGAFYAQSKVEQTSA